MAERDEDCKLSEECRKLGLCSFDASEKGCRASSDEDCLASERCKEEGACRLHPKKKECMVAMPLPSTTG